MSNERAIQLVDAATWLQLSGDTEGARRLFEQALKLDPGNVKALEHLAGTRATSSIEDATAHSSAGALESDWGAATTGEAHLPPTWDSETTRAAPVPAALLGPPPPSAWGGETTRVQPVPIELLGPPPPPDEAVVALPGPAATAPMGSVDNTFMRPPPLPINEDTLFGDMEPRMDSPSALVSDVEMPPPPPGDDAKTMPEFAPRGAPLPPPDVDDVTVPAATIPASAMPERDGHVPVPLVSEPALSATASSAWDARSNPGIQLPSGAEAKAMELLASAASPTIAPVELKGESVERLIRGAKDLLDLDDHTGAMELILKAKALAPNDPDVESMRERSEATLVSMFESKLRGLQAVPRVLLKDDEIIWLNLDHRAGFVLAQIDASVTFDDIFSLSGMSRLDTARILAQLIDEGVISRG